VGRDRLNQRVRTLLEAYVGPRYPESPHQADLLAAREWAVAQYGDVADAWYFLGDAYLHQGRYLGYADWAERATAAFERAVALDSSFAGPLSHLINIAAWRADTAAARRYGRLYAATAATTGRFDHLVRWDLARTLGDPAMMAEFGRRSTPPRTGWITWSGMRSKRAVTSRRWTAPSRSSAAARGPTPRARAITGTARTGRSTPGVPPTRCGKSTLSAVRSWRDAPCP
jgi:hypothetical protein